MVVAAPTSLGSAFAAAAAMGFDGNTSGVVGATPSESGLKTDGDLDLESKSDALSAAAWAATAILDDPIASSSPVKPSPVGPSDDESKLQNVRFQIGDIQSTLHSLKSVDTNYAKAMKADLIQRLHALEKTVESSKPIADRIKSVKTDLIAKQKEVRKALDL